VNQAVGPVSKSRSGDENPSPARWLSLPVQLEAERWIGFQWSGRELPERAHDDHAQGERKPNDEYGGAEEALQSFFMGAYCPGAGSARLYFSGVSKSTDSPPGPQ